VTSPVELHGVTIPHRSKVLLRTGSAGRDERQYPNADRFDMRREFSTLLRFPEWDVDHERAVRLHTSTVRGYSSVPIRI
jgi:hypothetical protein